MPLFCPSSRSRYQAPSAFSPGSMWRLVGLNMVETIRSNQQLPLNPAANNALSGPGLIM